MTDETLEIVKDSLIYGAVGTVISIPLMLWLVPKERANQWSTWTLPLILTGLGFVVKLGIHHYLEGEATT